MRRTEGSLPFGTLVVFKFSDTSQILGQTFATKKGKRKAQGVPQLQTAVLPRHQEEEETDKAQTEQTYKKQ